MDSLIEIHKSTDYGWFKFLPTNRTVGTSAKVKDSVSTFDITPYVPIIVTKDGGIIGGSTFHGDAIVARVNAGEMILNKRQQANLFRMLDSDRAASGINPAKVTFVLQGDKLVGCVDNYKAKMGLA